MKFKEAILMPHGKDVAFIFDFGIFKDGIT